MYLRLNSCGVGDHGPQGAEEEDWGGAGIRGGGVNDVCDGYRFLNFAGSETFFRALAFSFFSLCCCLCLSSPSLFAFLDLDILWDSVMHGECIGVFKRFCPGA